MDSRAPERAPRMLTAASPAYRTARKAARPVPEPSAGDAVATVSTRRLATAAFGTIEFATHSSVPATPPTIGPNDSVA